MPEDKGSITLDEFLYFVNQVARTMRPNRRGCGGNSMMVRYVVADDDDAVAQLECLIARHLSRNPEQFSLPQGFADMTVRACWEAICAALAAPVSAATADELSTLERELRLDQPAMNRFPVPALVTTAPLELYAQD